MRVRLGRLQRRRRSVDSGGAGHLRRGRFAALLLCVVAGGAMASIQLEPGDAGRDVIEVLATRRGDPGAALRDALTAVNRGERDAADAKLAAVAARYPVIADYADLLRLRVRIELGEFEAAAALAKTWSHPDSPLVAEQQELVGEALAALGDSAGARAAWDRAAEKSLDPARQSSLYWKRAESLREDGDLDAATEVYLKLWTEHPLAAEAELVNAALDAIAENRGTDPRTGGDQRKRGDALFSARRNEAALAAFEAALTFSDLRASDRRRALRKRAETLFRLRRYTEAVAAYDQLRPALTYKIERARALARSGEPKRGAADLEALGRGARGRDAVRALFLSALLWDGEGETERAKKLFDEVVRVGGGTSYSNAALWRFGWSAFRERRFEEARATFERLLERDASGISALRTRYWLARAREESSDIAGAHAVYEAIALEFPFSYYGWRARLKTGALPPTARSAGLPNGDAALTPEDLSRPRILLEAGLDADARRELDQLYARAASLGDRLGLSNLYATSGDFHQSQRLIVTEYSETLARGPVPSQIELWWHAWPTPYVEGIARATSNGDLIEPGLVYALMREESGYRPAVVSVSGARGLLQIMPDTGARLAEEVALESFDADDLFEPEINLQLGSHYLTTLLARFNGQKSAAIASYNAGETAVSRWLDPELDDDEWVESIPYDQTRKYVKRVLRSLHAYRVLY